MVSHIFQHLLEPIPRPFLSLPIVINRLLLLRAVIIRHIFHLIQLPGRILHRRLFPLFPKLDRIISIVSLVILFLQVLV